VRDEGPGIPAEARERVFERFFRLDKARARPQGGTGLGLAIVKNLVQAHGGEVRVESAEGRGTTFYFKLPHKNRVRLTGACKMSIVRGPGGESRSR
jgi:signal transduction histidine kinase